MQILLGVIYSWSMFRGPLAQLHGWSQAQTIAPYRYSILAFAAGMIIAGFWQDRKGPRVVASVGGLLLALGCLLAALLGKYVIRANCCVRNHRWRGSRIRIRHADCDVYQMVPDKRGFIVGLAVMGFGVGPLLFGPLIEALIGADSAAFGVTIPRTFLVLAAMFLVGVVGAAQFYRVPPAGWKPSGWTPPTKKTLGTELGPRQPFEPGSFMRSGFSISSALLLD